MGMKSKAMIYGLTRFAADSGDKYASVFMVEEKQANDSDRLGSIPMKVSSDFELIDSVRNIKFPAECEIDFDIVTAGGGKGGMHINSLTAVQAQVKPNTPPAKPN